MTKQELEQYIKDRQHIKRLKDKLAGECRACDTVRGSAVEWPYVEHTISIEGTDPRAVSAIQGEIDDLERQCEVVKAFVETIPDRELRAIMEFRFLYGFTWPKVLLKMRCTISVDAMRKRIERYFNKIS